jgi:Glycosyl hydrolase family 76
MTPRALHRVLNRTHLALLVAICVCLALCVDEAPAYAASSHARSRLGGGVGGSQYPSGANRPAIRVRPGELAHPASATGGTQSGSASSPTATGSKPATPVTPTSTKQTTKTVLHGNPARALLAFKTMQQYFYVQGTGLYKGEPYSFLWPFSQALAATVSLAHIPGETTSLAHELRVRMFGLERYWEASSQPSSQISSPEATVAAAAPLPSFAGTVAPPLGAGGTSYYDDNEWVGIELARIYELNHEAFALEMAQRIMAFVMAGWQTTGSNGKPLPCAGGVPFSNSPSNNSRNTVTDGPAAELGVQLYRITREPQYLSFARMAYAWVRQCLLTASNLYADHIQNNGEVEPMEWSYNQGTMMGAGALLYEATGEGAYLYQARQTAKAALEHFTTEKLELENPFFASVYFRNLLYLDSVTHDPPGPKLVQSYVNYAWQNLRLDSDLFVSGSPSTSTLLGQSAIVQLYALLSTPPATYF